jgi:type IV pilus assembly protein PilC
MATVTASTEKKIKEINYSWEGKDKYGKQLKGEMRAAGTVCTVRSLWFCSRCGL